MRQSTFFTMIIVTGIAIGFFAETLVHATTYAPEADSLAPSDFATSTEFATSTDVRAASSSRTVASGTSATASTQPSRLIIPALSIDANVQSVGLTAKGNMGIPSNFTDAAWYKYGTVPGQMGSAVIDGHVDNGLSLAGVFKHLKELKTGDDIYVTDQAGSKIHFKVADSQFYDYHAAPTDLIFNEKDAPRLRLITCTGDWVSQDRTYDERLVVTAVLAD